MNERVGNERVRRPVVRTGVERPRADHRVIGKAVIDHFIILDFPVTKGLHDTAQAMTAVMSGADADLCGVIVGPDQYS
jgi:hypothetical protein